MLAEGRSGEIRTTTGTLREARLGAYANVIVDDSGLGRYFEAARLGRLFTLAATGFTVVAANGPPPLAAAVQPIVGIANVANSGKAAAILRVTTQTRSGTPAGPFYLSAALSSGGLTAANAGTIANANLAGANSVMRALNNVALTGFVLQGSAAVLAIGGPTATAAGAGAYHADVELAGALIVPPGGLVGVLATGAGTTHVVDASIIWAEVDWPL